VALVHDSDSEHAVVGAKRKADEAVVVGKPAFQYQDVPVRVKSRELLEAALQVLRMTGNV
jgi:hypothetical protein